MRGDVTREMGHSVGLAHAGGCVIMVSDSYTRWDVCRIQTPQTSDTNLFGKTLAGCAYLCCKTGSAMMIPYIPFVFVCLE